MTDKLPISSELQQNAVKLELPVDLSWALEEVKAQTKALTWGNENWLSEKISWGYMLYAHDIADFRGDLELLKISGIEPFNFRIDSTNWEIITEWENQYLVSPDRNVKEIVSWRDDSLIWEQLFNWEWALKYMHQYWKRIPSEFEWEDIVKLISSKPEELEKILWKLCIGIRYFSSTTRLNSNIQRHNGVWWSSFREQACLYIWIPWQKIDPAPIIIANNTFNFIRCFKK